MEWHTLTSLSDLDHAEQRSADRTVVLFKHSTRCSVSMMAKRAFEQQWTAGNREAYLLDLIRHRDISNEIATRYGIHHESPQVVVLKASRPVFSTSHGSISAVHPIIIEE